jgi:hypothetical protein
MAGGWLKMLTAFLTSADATIECRHGLKKDRCRDPFVY